MCSRRTFGESYSNCRVTTCFSNGQSPVVRHLYPEDQRGFLQFCCLLVRNTHVTIFSDVFLRLDPIKCNLIPTANHKSNTEYSKEIKSFLQQIDITSMPLPKLPALFTGACRNYVEKQDDVSGIAVEQLIDGMDLDEVWCRRSIPADRDSDLQFALARLRGKEGRAADSFLNEVTCFITDTHEAQVIRAIPGRDIFGSDKTHSRSFSLSMEMRFNLMLFLSSSILTFTLLHWTSRGAKSYI